jgi:hypothetical protein
MLIDDRKGALEPQRGLIFVFAIWRTRFAVCEVGNPLRSVSWTKVSSAGSLLSHPEPQQDTSAVNIQFFD